MKFLCFLFLLMISIVTLAQEIIIQEIGTQLTNTNPADSPITNQRNLNQVLWEQNKPTVYPINNITCDFFQGANYGLYAADDFILSEQTQLETISVVGNQNLGDFQSVILGMNVYIYQDIGGLPSSDPSQEGTGLVEISNIDPASGFYTIVPIGDGFYTITIDLTSANGSALSLSAGTYWVSVFPTMDLATNDFQLRWTWTESVELPISKAKFIDPTDSFGFGLDNWSDMEEIDGFAFTLQGESTLGISESRISDIKIFPNPAKNILYFQKPEGVIIKDILLYDILGKKIAITFTEEYFDISQLNSGYYTLTLVTNKGNLNKKVVKI